MLIKGSDEKFLSTLIYILIQIQMLQTTDLTKRYEDQRLALDALEPRNWRR